MNNEKTVNSTIKDSTVKATPKKKKKMDQENCRWYKKYDDRRLDLIYKSCSSVLFYHFGSFKENSKLCIQPEAGQHDHKVYSSRNTALFTAKGEYKTVVRIWQQQNSQQGNLIPEFTSRPKLCSHKSRTSSPE